MKKMNLKFFGLGAKIVLPLFLLVGLFLSSATTSVAQTFKSLDDANQIVETEMYLLDKAGAAAHLVGTKSNASTSQKGEYEYFSYLHSTLSHGVQVAVEETYKKMQVVYPDSPMKEAIFQAHQKALEILTY